MAETVSPAELERMRASITPFTILDVRRQIDFEADVEGGIAAWKAQCGTGTAEDSA